MSVDNIYGFLGNRYVLAPGSIMQLGNQEGMNSVVIKVLGGGTLEIGGYSLVSVGYTTVAGTITNLTSVGQTFGTMYPISGIETFSANLCGKAYLYASGATCTVAVSVGRSQGF